MNLLKQLFQLFLLSAFSECLADDEDRSPQDRSMFCPDCQCPPPPECWNADQLGYKKMGELGFYKLHPMRYTWHDAKATCEREGTHLIIVRNKEEEKMISFMAKNRYLHIHVGFQKIITRKVTMKRTVLDEPFEKLSYKTWADPGVNSKIEECGAIEVGKGLRLLPCNIRLAFICERRKVK